MIIENNDNIYDMMTSNIKLEGLTKNYRQIEIESNGGIL